jgi:hypothetical protein
LSAVPRKRLLNDLNHAEALQDLDIARHCAPVALQFLRQLADRGWRLLDLLEDKHSLFRQDMEERLNVFECDYSTLLDGMTSPRSAAFASLRARSKNESTRSPRISVLHTSELLR